MSYRNSVKHDEKMAGTNHRPVDQLLFVLLSGGTVILLGVIIANNAHINAAIINRTGIITIIWVTILSLGVIIPAAMVAFSVGTWRLARALWRQSRHAAAWARQVMLWPGHYFSDFADSGGQ